MSAPILEARAVVRDLSNGAVTARILDGIDLAVHPGEFVALTGMSGSGKSTLLYLLGALDKPTAGQILIDGQDATLLDDDDRARLRAAKLGFVFQFHFLLPEFTVLENAMLPYQRRTRDRDAARASAGEALEQVGLSELARRKPHQLSGGQQQRVSIARALANRPTILLADEPTGNLDSKNGEAVMQAFEGLVARGLTVVMVTHAEEFAARCSRRVQMKDGRIVSDVALRDARHTASGSVPSPGSAM